MQKNKLETSLSEYLKSQRHLAVDNLLLRELIEYYSPLPQPVLIADLDDISFIVGNHVSGVMNSEINRIPFYGAITGDVLYEMYGKYGTKLEVPQVKSMEGNVLYVLSAAEALPIGTIQGCLELISEGDFINLLEEEDYKELPIS
jgi:hypothetical protein